MYFNSLNLNRNLKLHKIHKKSNILHIFFNLIILTENSYDLFAEQHKRQGNEKAKEAATATVLPTPTPMLAAVASFQFSTPTTAQVTPTALSTTSSVNPNSITPASQ